jgi:hypothetical protein
MMDSIEKQADKNIAGFPAQAGWPLDTHSA